MSRPDDDADALAGVVRAEYGRVVAGLIRRFGDIGLAEDALGEAVLVALERWPRDGLPPNPAGRMAIDDQLAIYGNPGSDSANGSSEGSYAPVAVR